MELFKFDLPGMVQRTAERLAAEGEPEFLEILKENPNKVAWLKENVEQIKIHFTNGGVLMKTCKCCHRELPETNFYRDNRYSDGLSSFCKECTKKNANTSRTLRKAETQKVSTLLSHIATAQSNEEAVSFAKYVIGNCLDMISNDLKEAIIFAGEVNKATIVELIDEKVLQLKKDISNELKGLKED